MQAEARIQGRTLLDPAIDIHHNPRKDGADATGALPIPYAMVVSLFAPKMKDLYNQIFARYQFQLAPLRPVLQLPVPVKK